jgi:hypothetical protein
VETMTRRQALDLGAVMATIEERAGEDGLKLMAKMDEALRSPGESLDQLKTQQLIAFGKQLADVLGQR